MTGRGLLLPSPLLPPVAYAGLAAALGRVGLPTTLAPLPAPGPPEALDLVRAWSEEAAGARVLVAHSNAGYLAPLVRAAAAGGPHLVLVDAALPPVAGPTRLAPPRFRAHLASLVGEDGLLPPWTRWWAPEDLAGLAPPDALAAVDQACPRLPLGYLDTEVEAPRGWVASSNAYLAFGPTYADELALAREHGWPHHVLDGRHLHHLVDPHTVARAVTDLLGRLESATTAGA